MFFIVYNAKLACRDLTLHKWWENLAWTVSRFPNPLPSSGDWVIIPGIQCQGMGCSKRLAGPSTSQSLVHIGFNIHHPVALQAQKIHALCGLYLGHGIRFVGSCAWVHITIPPWGPGHCPPAGKHNADPLCLGLIDFSSPLFSTLLCSLWGLAFWKQ